MKTADLDSFDRIITDQGLSDEWADLIREILPEKCIRIVIEKDLTEGFDYRKIKVQR